MVCTGNTAREVILENNSVVYRDKDSENHSRGISQMNDRISFSCYMLMACSVDLNLHET